MKMVINKKIFWVFKNLILCQSVCVNERVLLSTVYLELTLELLPMPPRKQKSRLFSSRQFN